MYGKSKNCLTCRQLQLSNKFRQLWNEHVLWTRSFIVSTALCLPDIEAVTDRLLQNPCDFARVLRRFYGRHKAETFKRLFTDHLLIAAALVTAAKTGDCEEYEKQRRLWYRNAEDIAKFLASINPFWKVCLWRGLLFDHLRMTEDEAAYILDGQFERSIRIYQCIQQEAMKMADVLTCGIVRQFCVR